MQRACVPIPLAFNASMVGPVIATFGSQAQKERFLPPTANLDIWWSQGFSEPDAGSDLASLRTTAVRHGDEWMVNGQKTWTTLGQYGDWIFNLVRTDPDAPKRQQGGISFLLIDMTTPGVTVRPIELIDGGHEVNEVWFEDVRVPAENLVGEENKGWDLRSSSWATSGSAWPRSARPSGCWPRPSSGTRGAVLEPLVAAHFADPGERAARPGADRAPRRRELRGRQAPPCLLRAQAQGTELPRAVGELVVDLAGPGSLASGASHVPGLPAWARVATPSYLNLRKASIYGGSNEVQRQIIAGTILGL